MVEWLFKRAGVDEISSTSANLILDLYLLTYLLKFDQ